ncbi:histone-fold-containing protein [Mycena floridula]|nr:histone-fold-containing protein [Mycena floridula]
MPRKDAVTGPISAQAQQDLVSDGIENFELPKTIVTKIAKSALPENTKLQKETILSLVKGSTVFINYLAATAHDVAIAKQHKSISASDVLKALEVIELGDLAEQLQSELAVYREQAKTDKTKKGTSNIVGPQKAKSASTAGATPTPSVAASVAPDSPPSVASKSIKGKEKASELPPPFTSVPLPAFPSDSISTGPTRSMDDDPDQSMDYEAAANAPEEDMEGDEEEDEVPEEEELVDAVALEEEELRKDNKGLDERSAVAEAADHPMDGS